MIEPDLQTDRRTPVEVKQSRLKLEFCDEIRLCAQALWLEEMTGQTVDKGVLRYRQTCHCLLIMLSEKLWPGTLFRENGNATTEAEGN